VFKEVAIENNCQAISLCMEAIYVRSEGASATLREQYSSEGIFVKVFSR
jgi:hypothetical protein